MKNYFEVIDFWIKNIVENEDDYTIESNQNGKFSTITIFVKKTSIGRIIGKNGRVIGSLRTLITSLAKKHRYTVKLEIKEM